MIDRISTPAQAKAPAATEQPEPRMLQAARDFEAIFLRQMLKSLEKTTGVGPTGQASTAERSYGSMVVSTLADSISHAGGLGLSDLIAKSLAPRGVSESTATPLGAPGGAPPKPLK